MTNSFVLEMKRINKTFPGVKALKDIDFHLQKGEIHGLIGENGAGKSTLMKVLAGMYLASSGKILINGEEVLSLTPKVVESLGIYFIHQERNIVPSFTVAQTLFLGREKQFVRFGRLNQKQMQASATSLLKEKLDIDIDGSKLLSELTVGEQQLVQVCRAIYQEPSILILDEPTAVLAKKEKDILFHSIDSLRQRGISIIYISHYFNEILDICDRITVLRDGEKVSTLQADGLKIKDIVYQITGKNIIERKIETPVEKGEILLELNRLSKRDVFTEVSITVKEGEVVGVTGLMGSGYNLLPEAILSHKKNDSGDIRIRGKTIRRMTPQKAVELGVGYIPEDRRGTGIIKRMTVKENITLTNLADVKTLGILRSNKEKSLVQKLINRLRIRTPHQQEEVEFLSGGNQQKVVVAKWLHSGTKLFILHQPTAAVDVGAKEEIYLLIKELVHQGAGVLLVSQDLKELQRLTDRTLVMYRGEVINELIGKALTEDQLMVAIMGGEKHESSYRQQTLSIQN